MKLEKLPEENIRQAVADYGAYTATDEVLNAVSDGLIDRLAHDAAVGKKGLREMLRKSSAWDEELQAVVINGTRTHDPDFERVSRMIYKATKEWQQAHNYKACARLGVATTYFTHPKLDEYDRKMAIAALNELAPGAYRPNKKKSRVLKGLFDALGITDESAGSEFQKLFAELADEINGKKINFKLFLSINPAHFITMSNPKNDRRGEMLTSCHSFNAHDYEYNNGCTGYARDDVTMIAFTVADPDNRETLNNRKTTRQLFMYKPGNGLLLQSRMYTSGGGVYGASELSPLYRDLVQREISACEGALNLWKTKTYAAPGDCVANPDWEIECGAGFGGYCDWVYSNFDAKISIRSDRQDDYETFTVGRPGLCIRCGAETSHGLYCTDCEGHIIECWHCEYTDTEDYMYTVYDEDGIERWVCEECLSNYYEYCGDCGDYHHSSNMHRVAGGRQVCESCFEDYELCNDCGEYHRREDCYEVYDSSGRQVWACSDCYDRYYTECAECGCAEHSGDLTRAYDSTGCYVDVCLDCIASCYVECDECGEYYHESLVKDGKCSDCRAEAEDEEEATA